MRPSRLLLPLALLATTVAAPAAGERVLVNLNTGWRFDLGDVPQASEPGFDDRAWQAIELPHTWNGLDGEDGGNDYHRGPGWYRRHFTPDASLAGRRLYLQFDGACLMADVYVNGVHLGNHSREASAQVPVRRHGRAPPRRGQRDLCARRQRQARHPAHGRGLHDLRRPLPLSVAPRHRSRAGRDDGHWLRRGLCRAACRQRASRRRSSSRRELENHGWGPARTSTSGSSSSTTGWSRWGRLTRPSRRTCRRAAQRRCSSR